MRLLAMAKNTTVQKNTMVLSAQSMEVLIHAMPNLKVYRPPWYPRYHPGDLTVTYDEPSPAPEPPAKRRRARCECAALERYRRSKLAPWVWNNTWATAGPASTGAFTW
eukprot:COSAG06_NODE_9089_length_1989_cov_36.719577_2_plen_108_part_00